MTLHHSLDTHSHCWLIVPDNPPAARRLRPLTVHGVVVHDLTLTGPDPETLADALAAHDRLAGS